MGRRNGKPSPSARSKQGTRKRTKREPDPSVAAEQQLTDIAAHAFHQSFVRLHRAYLRLYWLRVERLQRYIRDRLLLEIDIPRDDPLEASLPKPPEFVRLLPFGRGDGQLQMELLELIEGFFQSLYSNIGFFIQYLVHLPVPDRAQMPRNSVERWLQFVRNRHPGLTDQVEAIMEAREFRTYFIAHPALNTVGTYAWYFACHAFGGQFIYVPIYFQRTAEDVIADSIDDEEEIGRVETPDAEHDEDFDASSNPYSASYRPSVRTSRWKVPPDSSRVFDAWVEVVSSLLKTLGINFRGPSEPDTFEAGWPEYEPTYEVHSYHVHESLGGFLREQNRGLLD